MKTKNQKKVDEKEMPLLEQKGYERMLNEIVPVQQTETYRNPTQRVVKEAVRELNPDTNSLGKAEDEFILCFLFMISSADYKRSKALNAFTNFSTARSICSFVW